MTGILLTEGDVERGRPPDLRRLRATAALAPHLEPTDPQWHQVLDWVAAHLDLDAAAAFGTKRQQAQQLRDAGRLSDAHTLTSWALEQAKRVIR